MLPLKHNHYIPHIVDEDNMPFYLTISTILLPTNDLNENSEIAQIQLNHNEYHRIYYI